MVTLRCQLGWAKGMPGSLTETDIGPSVVSPLDRVTPPSCKRQMMGPLSFITMNWGACPGHTMVLQPSERHNRDWSHGRLGPWCSPTGSPAPLSCETGCGEGSWILVCRLLVPTQVSLLSMEEDIDTRKINNSFLRDHSYATEADIISTVEFNHTGELLATGDKGGRVVIFQREQESKNQVHRRGEYNVYSTFQSHEPEFDYLKSLEIEEKINKIRWLPQQNAAYFLLSTNDKTVKLWKVSERDKRPEGYNLKDEEGRLRDPATITTLRVPVLRPMDLMVEATPRRVFANAHTYHINSISVNSDYETYMSADDLRINLWNFEITNQSFNIVDIKPANMEELTEVITAAEFHPHHCNTFVYSSSKGTIRLCDMRASALCDRHTKFFEEPEDPSNRSFFSEIISSISDVKFSHSGRYIMTRDYLTVKVWDLNMENRPIETYQVHDYLRSKLCSLYENDCIFDKFECVWNGSDSVIMTGSYNNFFRMFDRNTKRDVTLEASRENSKPRAILKPRKVCVGGKRRKDEISVDSLDFSKKILHTAWHPSENIIAVAATNNLYIFQDKVN
uniref:Serine/threonine-protein phosphatase 2A 55 kDa regulatory subunit B n=1 Tax=Felis catus TaxID=9685 RepID=A0ABI7YW74_FELCA